MYKSFPGAKRLTCHARIIGAGTGPAGPTMAGPFSAEVETTFVWSHS